MGLTVTYGPDGAVVAVTGEADKPNTPNNPYFGKPPKSPKDFWGLLLSVFVARAGGTAAGLDRMERLMSSKRAAPVVKIIDSVEYVDPDDKDGDFLKLSSILTTTAHETDNALLLEPVEFAAFMTAWR